MAEEILRSKHAFGQLENVPSAIETGKVDAYDLILAEDANERAHIGWISKSGEFKLVENQDVVLVTGDALPESGEDEVIYIFNNSLYYWDGTNFVSVSAEGVSEDVVDTKIENILTEANTYTDQKISEIVTGYEIVEF